MCQHGWLWRSISVKSQRDLLRRWPIRDFKIRLFTRNESPKLPENLISRNLHLRIRHWWSEMTRSFKLGNPNSIGWLVSESFKYSLNVRVSFIRFFYSLWLCQYVLKSQANSQENWTSCEEAEYLNKSLEKYMWRNQRKMTEARERERADLLNRGVGKEHTSCRYLMMRLKRWTLRLKEIARWFVFEWSCHPRQICWTKGSFELWR